MTQDLEIVNPMGRLDVLLYRLGRQFVQNLEQKHGVSGIWDNLQPTVNQAIAKHVGGIDLPIEARILLGIVQSNLSKTLEGDK